MMLKLILLFAVVWLIFAVFDPFSDRDVFRAYSASEAVGNDPGEDLPKLLPNAVKNYRIRDHDVVLQVGNFVNEYDTCKVFDRNNWSCTYSDESATFGAKLGEYFDRSNLEKFPHLAVYGEEKALSRFEYILLQCRWDASGGFDALLCLFRPFTI